jgi:two-component system, response regulator YesN
VKVLIVDDEANVREGLRVIIDWEACGFAICGEGVNGSDGLTKILELNPELTLLDIKMPLMNGIEVAEQAAKAGYRGKIIILSGYSDFGYAQNAIRFGVSAYLLKPIDEDELMEVVKKTCAEIQKQAETATMERESQQIVRNNLLCDILQGNTPPDRRTIAQYNFNTERESYQVAVVEYGNVMSSADDEAKGMVQQFVLENSIDCVGIEGRSVLMLNSADCIARFMRAINTNSSKINSTKTIICLGRVVKSFEEISLSYKDAYALIVRKFFFEKDKAIACHTTCGDDRKGLTADKKSIRIDEYWDKIYICIEVGEIDMILSLLDDIDHFYRSCMIKPDKVVGILTNFYYEILKRIQAHHSQLDEKLRSYAEISGKLDDMNSLSDIISWLRKEFCRLAATIGNDSNEDIIMKLLNYIDKYSDINISLESLAAIFGYNSTYLGRVFKNTVGENFLSYLDKARINKAEDLLIHSDLKVYEIAVKVGYVNLDYFYVKFKKYTGKSPNEYRKNKPLAASGG